MKHFYEEVTFEQFIIFIRSHQKQIEENMNIYLNLEPYFSEQDRKITGVLLESFFKLIINLDLKMSDDEYKKHLDTWMHSQVATMNIKNFNLFLVIFEKSVITFIANAKQNSFSIIMFLLTIYSHLIFTFNQMVDEIEDLTANPDLVEIDRLRQIDKLNKLLISCSGEKDLPFILNQCEVIFHYKRCVFYAYIPWSQQFYGVIGAELPKVQSMKGHIGTNMTTVFHTKKPIFLKDPHTFVKEEHIKLFNLSSVIFVPIVHHNQVYGWLTFDQMGVEFDCSKEELILLDQVGKRIGLYLSRSSDESIMEPKVHLTDREAMILDLLAEGYDNKKMGEVLHLSEHTIRDYVGSLMTKLQAKNRTQVVASAFSLGLLM
ncbi:MAG: LuxR C-terminal-related transcriptional regulator [Heyndrickxia sp.]